MHWQYSKYSAIIFLYNRFFMILIANLMNDTVYYLRIVKMAAHDISMMT